MDLEIRGKVALVTGGSRGLGRAICRRLAAEGARVIVNYRSGAEEARAVIAEINAAGAGSALAVPGDVSCEADVVNLFAEAERQWGLVEILVNNAAVCPTCAVHELSHAVWSETLKVNLDGTFLACREMTRRLLAADRGGRIVNVTSTAAYLGSTTGHAPYDASKGGLVALTISLARELANRRIAVNAVAPGMIRTDMTDQALRANEAKYLSRIPVQRIAQPEELADVVAFLASARASYMTGAVVNVSGGLLMG
jgi:3-oxoacyl-[acyl-carrier protein] reductase